MRLLSTENHELTDVSPDKIPRYAILSHTWGDEEVDFARLQCGNWVEETEGMRKIRNGCRKAKQDGYDYLWVDTCCIDKRNSAELSEAINSMYDWYRLADVCYAYLADVDTPVESESVPHSFRESRWFTRGWTLQELIAPTKLEFFGNRIGSKDWHPLGTKIKLSKTISEVTSIDEDILTKKKLLGDISIAQRMSWAAHRNTSRLEDRAYCLMGIFSVNMPMIYGEGERAFIRLQEEIMRYSDDESLFAWTSSTISKPSPESVVSSGFLASSPAAFARSSQIVPYSRWEARTPYNMTNRGLSIDLPLFFLEGKNMYLAALDCPALGRFGEYVAVAVRRLAGFGNQYVRIEPEKLFSVPHRENIQTIYVPQGHLSSRVHEVYPHHYCQLYRGPPAENGYRLLKVLEHPRSSVKIAFDVSSLRPSWIPGTQPFTFELAKGVVQVACLLVFEETQTGRRLVVAAASTVDFGLTFDVFDADSSELPLYRLKRLLEGDYAESAEKAYMSTLEELKDIYQPQASGTRVELEDHGYVCVNIQVHTKGSSKYFIVNIDIGPAPRPSILEALLGYPSDPTDEAATLLQEESPKSAGFKLWPRSRKKASKGLVTESHGNSLKG